MSTRERTEDSRSEGAQPPSAQPLAGPLALVLTALACWRIVYHSQYIRDVPFALGTFSDGRQYELAARDILANPPLGTEPFYLQGAYAYFMALPMAIRPWPSLALLAQMLVAGLALWGFYRAVASFFGRNQAGIATAILMAYPMVAFYETKFLTASLAVASSIALLAAVARASSRPTWQRVVLVGMACGAASLFRPNLVIVIPFVGVALWKVAEDRITQRRALLGAILGLLLVLAPMSLRNLVVTGSPTIFPAHGGGTSFYIGNNQHARGVWNTAGGLLTGDVSQERAELLDELGIGQSTKVEEMDAVGRALYERAFDEIAEDPAGWVWLELRKVWLLVGSDELSQDYDIHGERELTLFDERIGIPFGALVVFGCLGAFVLREQIRRASPRDSRRLRALGWTLLGLVLGTVSANLLYFTSSQHRLPLAVPLAVLAGLAVQSLLGALRDLPHMSSARKRRGGLLMALVVVALAATFVPRSKKDEPSAMHYYNLAVVCLSLDEPTDALVWMDRAVERSPNNPVLRIERATLRRLRGRFAEAGEDLAHLRRLEDVPAWILLRAEDERRRVATWQELPEERISGRRKPPQ